MLCVATLCSMSVYAQNTYKLSIEELFELADKNSKIVKANKIILQETGVGVEEAKNTRLPEINISLSANYLGDGYLCNRDFSNGTSTSMPHFGNNFVIEVIQTIYSGGSINGGIAIAKLKEEIASINLKESSSKVKFMLIGFYLELYKLKNILQIYDKNIELTKSIIANTRERNLQGVALLNDITRYELQLKDLELQRIRTNNSIKIINNELVTILDLPHRTVIEPDIDMLHQHQMAIANQHISTNCEEVHAVKRGKLAVKMSEKEIKIARSNLLPKVSLIAGNHFDGPITIEVPPINKNFNYWYVGVGVSYNLSSLYKSNKSIKRTKFVTEQKRKELEVIKENAELAIEADYTKYLETFEEVSMLEKSLELAHQNFLIVETRYNNEMALVTDMLDATNQLLNAELQLSNARINTIFNYYKLQNSTGNL